MEIFCLLKNMVFNLFYNREKKEFLMYKELDVYDFVKEFRNSRFKDNFSEHGNSSIWINIDFA